jgi:flagellar biosynthesis/type III secretory pathway M-ring protein FliF/YscJ
MTAEQVSAALASASGPDAIEGSLARELTSGPSDGIVEIVDEHPDEVAHLLRGWLTDSGAAKAAGGGR